MSLPTRNQRAVSVDRWYLSRKWLLAPSDPITRLPRTVEYRVSMQDEMCTGEPTPKV